MAGYILYNGFWNRDELPDPVARLTVAAKRLGVELTPVANTQVYAAIDSGVSVPPFRVGDFVLFWDKDVRLGRALERMGVRLFNGAEAVALCDDKSATHLALAGHIAMPKTLVAPMTYIDFDGAGDAFLKRAAEEVGFPCVVKECYGSLGGQVYLAHDAARLRALADSMCAKPFIVQEYVAESRGEDVRLYVVGDEVAAAMRRRNANDFRANIAEGGTGEAYAPTEEECRMALAACRRLGLVFGGVDLLHSERGPLLCEVNASAFMAGIIACTGVDVADRVMRYVLSRL